MNVSKLVVGLVVASFSLVSFAFGGDDDSVQKGQGNVGKAAVMKKMKEPTKKEKLKAAKKKQVMLKNAYEHKINN